MTPQELHIVIKGCIANDRRCQELLYKTYYTSMMALVKRYIECPHIAEEVLNDGYLRMFKCLPQYTYSGSFEGWMRRIMFHAVADTVRSDKRITTAKKREQGKFLEKSLEVRYDTSHGYEIFAYEPASNDNKHLEEQDIWKLIDTLPNVTGKVFKMYLEGYVHRDIAQAMEITEGTSKWHVNQARNYLKARLSY
jgi:RNA polymerase sigma-70 factor (ECF subfamily)